MEFFDEESMRRALKECNNLIFLNNRRLRLEEAAGEPCSAEEMVGVLHHRDFQSETHTYLYPTVPLVHLTCCHRLPSLLRRAHMYIHEV